MPTLSGVIANLLFLNGLRALNVQVIIPNNVTWSLFYEMTFYILAPLSWLIAPGRAGLIVLSLAFGWRSFCQTKRRLRYSSHFL